METYFSTFPYYNSHLETYHFSTFPCYNSLLETYFSTFPCYNSHLKTYPCQARCSIIVAYIVTHWSRHTLYKDIGWCYNVHSYCQSIESTDVICNVPCGGHNYQAKITTSKGVHLVVVEASLAYNPCTITLETFVLCEARANGVKQFLPMLSLTGAFLLDLSSVAPSLPLLPRTHPRQPPRRPVLRPRLLELG